MFSVFASRQHCSLSQVKPALNQEGDGAHGVKKGCPSPIFHSPCSAIRDQELSVMFCSMKYWKRLLESSSRECAQILCKEPQCPRRGDRFLPAHSVNNRSAGEFSVSSQAYFITPWLRFIRSIPPSAKPLLEHETIAANVVLLVYFLLFRLESNH